MPVCVYVRAACLYMLPPAVGTPNFAIPWLHYYCPMYLITYAQR